MEDKYIIKKAKLYEDFINEISDDYFEPVLLSNRDKVDMRLFKKLMPKTARTVKDAETRIQTWKGGTMFTHFQYFIVEAKNLLAKPKYRFHNSQYWLNDTQLGWMGRKGEKVNITLLTITDITDPENEERLGEIYVNTDVYLKEHRVVFNEIEHQS